MAALLADKFHFKPATKSKLATAMESLKIEPIVKKMPEDLKIRLDERLDLALKKILKTEFMWMGAQRFGAMTDRDPDFVHQARVATRRMRSALIMFHDALPEQTVKFHLSNTYRKIGVANRTEASRYAYMNHLMAPDEQLAS